MGFPERLKYIRKKRKKTQKDVADYLQVSVSSISAYELGRNQPEFETLVKISIFLETSVDYLLGRDVIFLKEQHKSPLNRFYKNVSRAQNLDMQKFMLLLAVLESFLDQVELSEQQNTQTPPSQ